MIRETKMEIGLGLDAGLNLSLEEQAELSREAARLGYTSVWTPEGSGQDSFQLCAMRWDASRSVVPEGVSTGIAVSPVMYRTPIAFAMSGGTLSERTGGRFIMGIGSGGAYRPKSRQSLGLKKFSALALMRDYLATIRCLVAGGEVNYEGEVVTLKSAKLGINPAPNTPVYLGALGPEMLRLAGEMADGACLNWCNPERIAWSRERIAEGAARANRDPSDIKMVEYIRVCIDDDVDAARLAYAKATMGYALGAQVPTPRERELGYRGHFERMGYTEELAMLDQMRTDGSSRDDVANAFTPGLLRDVGYYGPAGGAAAEFKRLSQGLDTAVVRVVAARPGIESILAVMRACRPELVV
jgi:alkanesulfonate monooxygenase SsuD/methylene tetrahydromethanopterin reductase-like flavin-dependent oxidoreductase (luciferase family)